MEYNSEHSMAGWVVLILIIASIIYYVFNYYNIFSFSAKTNELKNRALDAIDNRPRQLMTQTPPSGKEFCVQNSFTSVIGWDSINNCCLYEWQGNNNILQTCITAQINGNTIYSLFNNEYIENYENYLNEVI